MSTAVLPQTADELKTYLGRLPLFAGRSLSATPVLGGLTNHNWCIESGGDPQKYFIRVPGVGTDEFIDRQAAHEAAVRAADMGIGPRVFFFDEETGIEIHEMLEGEACSYAVFSDDREALAESMGLFRQWHRGALLTNTKTIFEMAEEHREQLREAGVVLPAWFDEVERGYEAASAAMHSAGLDIVPCHNDPNPANFVRARGKPMKVTDFEYASNNERSYELGAVVGYYSCDDECIHYLMESYFDRVELQHWSRVKVMAAVTDFKWGLWAIVNALTWDVDFDYYKYGTWNLWRAYYAMHVPEWPSILAGV